MLTLKELAEFGLIRDEKLPLVYALAACFLEVNEPPLGTELAAKAVPAVIGPVAAGRLVELAALGLGLALEPAGQSLAGGFRMPAGCRRSPVDETGI